MYGDAGRTVKARKDKLLAMGPFPKFGSKAPSHVKSQVEWLLTVENLLQDMFDLADKSVDCNNEVFNISMLRTIKNFFPETIHSKFSKFRGTTKEQMEMIFSEVTDMRRDKQSLFQDVDNSTSAEDNSRKSAGGAHCCGGGQQSSHASRPFTPFRFEACRICCQLEKDGDTDDIYEDHTNKYPFGCPRFAQMTTRSRAKMANQIMLCLFCLDGKFVRKSGAAHANCPTLQKTQSYTCKANNCNLHYLICEKHVKVNKEALERSQKFWSGKNKHFSTTVYPASSHSAPKVPEPKSSSNVEVDRGLTEASKTLKLLAKGSKVRDAPQGDPLFLFSLIPGINRDLTCFYDPGCSHMLTRSCVPHKELPAVKIRDGPIALNAAGDVRVEADAEWAMLVDREDGSKQVLYGLSCERITSTFPLINVSAAFQEIIKKAPKQKRDLISRLKVPDVVGGDPDILLGILYNNVHPTVVHELPSGLFIAKLRLASTNGYTATIGGPHQSFMHYANQVGGAKNLFAYFMDGLKNYRKYGPPSLPAPLVTHEDLEFFEAINEAEVVSIIGGLEDKMVEDAVLEPEPDKNPKLGFTMQCQKCGEDVEENVEDLLEDIAASVGKEKVKTVAAKVKLDESNETLHDLKTFIKLQDQGIDLAYRCPKCRNCHDCRNANETERISVREEIEDQAIKDSINIDFKKKRITAKLPLRGDENKLLSNNRKSALKVLEGQCTKFQNDQETKDLVIKAFNKLLDRGFAVKFDDLSQEQQDMISNKVNYWIPWRTVFKESVSSPARPVFDASSKTPVLPDGNGGRCLNDLTMKGRVNTLNLIKMLLRWEIGPEALCGDLKAFYPSIALDESQWNLQRVLWKENMDVDAETQELVIITLIFGIRAVSALSEQAIIKLAHFIRLNQPRLAELMEDSRFVDDLADSLENKEVIKALVDEADKLFESVGLECKGWSMSGSPPHPDVTADGFSVDVGGITWWPEVDCIIVKIPQLHFGKKSRGRLVVGTEVFKGQFADMEKFVPQRLTRRQVVSKFSAIHDPLGKFVPITGAMKVHVRRAVMETSDWDGHVSAETRSIWVKNFWRLEKLKGLQFSRARIPIDAVNTKLQLVACVDAANELKIAAVYARFLRRNGEYSSQNVIGRSLLVKENSSIPREELEALTIGSNLLWMVRKSLEGWLDDYMLCSDSCIALCWVIAENKRLSLFFRNRCNQVKFNTDIDNLWFLRTLENPADVGTRTEKVTLSSVGPDSVWEKGTPWMTGSVEAAVDKDILKPAANLKVSEKEDEEFLKGFVFERTPEILVHGHQVNQERVNKMTKRAEFSNYIFMPTKYDFRKTVKITALVFKYIRCLKAKVSARTGKDVKSENVEQRFKMFPASFQSSSIQSSTSLPQVVSGDDLNRALDYWFKKATAEVEKFVKPETLSKIGIKKNGIIFCRSRILDGQRFLEAGGFLGDSVGLELGLSLITPLVDRHSPIAYSIAKFIHETVAKHAGFETALRISLEYVHIMQGHSLFREIAEECTKCLTLRKKYIEVAMGPVSQNQLTIAPCFHVAYVDLYGPFWTFVPGYERETRNKKALNARNWIMGFACPMAKLLNLQVIEAKNSEAVLEGLTRLACEVGMPFCLVLDQETSFMKMVRDAEINLKDIMLRGYQEFGIRFEVAPVSGHNYNGLIERKLRTVGEMFDKIELSKKRLHATGLQTLCKLVENEMNNTPLGYSYGRDSNNTPILRILTPNMMKIGRLNSRSLSGPMKYPSGPLDYLKLVQETYKSWYDLWNISVLPKMIPQPRWFKDSKQIKQGDVIMFQKVDNVLSSDWTVGQVESVVRSKDGAIRRVEVRYHNGGPGPELTQNEMDPKFTDRAVRALVRLFNVEDNYYVEDMAEVERIIGDLENKAKADEETHGKVEPLASAQYNCINTEVRLNNCCCSGHCALAHFEGAKRSGTTYESLAVQMSAAPVIELNVDEDYDDPAPLVRPVPVGPRDEVLAVLTALETKFDLA